ncbi:MAG TPA: acetate/propionate family kinase [Pirellulales bacterium]|jgi:acetate kinase|nr:acetate/propionate family kinase [Pirellulales bacterium]
MDGFILTVNGGSSSVKVALFDAAGLQLARKSSGSFKSQNSLDAAQGVLDWIKQQQLGAQDIAAIGHRIVHGGPKYLEHALITPEMLAELKRVSPIDPDHLPGEIALIEALGKSFPQVSQVACFDTAFHRDLPAVAKRLPIPRKYEAEGVHRYGFHGLSYSYLMDELARQAGATAAQGRIILAHLGAGASMAAVYQGKCIDTTMSFTPTAGLVMATRTGDLDPGLLVYLMRQEKMTADQIDDLVNRKSGLLGISESSSDMKELLEKRSKDTRAALAVDIFCYQARKWIGALAAALGGLNTLVFSGGIGEHAADVRSQICSHLGHLGVNLDAAGNAADGPVISANNSPATVRVIPTDEEIVIARTTIQIANLKF